MNNNSSNPAKASVGYTLGNYLLKGISFATVPVFTRILSQKDFGIYNAFLGYEAILYILIGLALHSSLKNAYIKYNRDFDKYVSSITILPIIITLIIGIIGYFCRYRIGALINLDPNTIIWIVIHSYCSGVVIFYSSKIALTYNYKEYIKVSTVNAIGNVLVSILLIYTFFYSCRYMGRIIGSTIIYMLVAGYILYGFFRIERPTFNKEYMQYALKVSIPIIPHGLAQILLLQSDRIMINAYIGNEEAAIYSFSYSIYSIVQITTNSLSTVFEPWFFRHMKNNPNNKERVIKIGTGIAVTIAFITLGLMIFSPEAILILGGKKYNDSFACLLPVLFAGFFAMTYSIPSVTEYYYEKTKYIAIGTTIAAALNAILNIVFIPQYGYIAAAYTTLISYIVYYLLHIAISKRLYGEYIIGIWSNLFFIVTLLVTWSMAIFFKEWFIVRIICFFVLSILYLLFLLKKMGRNEVVSIVKSVMNR